MNSVLSPPTSLVEYLDIVDIALATISRRLPAAVSRDDLASAGKLALVGAFSQFDGTPDEIRAYCFVRVRGAMLDELRRLDPLSRRHRALAGPVARAVAELEVRLGRVPRDHEVAAAAGVAAADVEAVRVAARPIDDVAWEGIADAGAPSPAESTESADVRAGLRAALARLPANQALALRRYYLEDATLDDIAAELGVSRERARQVREAGEKRLRADLVVLALWRALIDAEG
jgi:RNA polymerase sigma factor FliA